MARGRYRYLLQHADRWLAGVPDGARCLVPLCGKSHDLRYLAYERHLHVVGIELSALACGAFFAEQQIAYTLSHGARFNVYRSDDGRITLLQGDLFHVTLAELGGVPCDVVWDRGSLVALPPHLRRRYVPHIRALVTPTVRYLLTAVSYNQADMDGPPYAVLDNEVQKHYGGSMTVERLSVHPATSARFATANVRNAEEHVFLMTGR